MGVRSGSSVLLHPPAPEAEEDQVHDDFWASATASHAKGQGVGAVENILCSLAADCSSARCRDKNMPRCRDTHSSLRYVANLCQLAGKDEEHL